MHNPVTSARTKHIDVSHHLERKRVAEGTLVVQYVRTGKQTADILTKPLGTVAFALGVQGLSMRTSLGIPHGGVLEWSTLVGGGQIIMSPPGETAAAPTDRADTAPGRDNLQARGECREDVMPGRLHSRMATPAVFDMQPGRPRVSGTGRVFVAARGVCGEWRVLRGSRAVRSAGVQPPMLRGTPGRVYM